MSEKKRKRCAINDDLGKRKLLFVHFMTVFRRICRVNQGPCTEFYDINESDYESRRSMVAMRCEDVRV